MRQKIKVWKAEAALMAGVYDGSRTFNEVVRRAARELKFLRKMKRRGARLRWPVQNGQLEFLVPSVR